MKKILHLSLAALVFLVSCSKKNDPKPNPKPSPEPGPVVTPYVPDDSFKIIAYMPSYRDPNLIPDSKYKMITHLFYSFLLPTTAADGNLQSLSNPGYFATLRNKAKANNVKFGVSIGPGTGITETTYLTIAQNATSRAAFVKNIVTFAKVNQLDGVDMDWEYPRNNNGGSQAFHLLMKELSTALHAEGKFLSAAVTAGVYASTNRDAILEETYQYMDFVNIMQYDGAGYDKDEPLNHASYKMSVASLDWWLGTRKLPKNKAIVGMPLYGKNSAGSSIAFSAIEAAGQDVTLNIATVSGVQYGYNGINTIKQKTQLAKDRANGIMFWEFSHDSNTSNSLIKAANDQLGRSYQ